MAKRTIGLNDLNRPIGEWHHNAKLSDSDVDAIQELREQGMSLTAIAQKFGVGKACVYKIVTGRTRCQIAVRWVVVDDTAEEGRITKRREPLQRAEQTRVYRERRRSRESQGARELDSAIRAWAR